LFKTVDVLAQRASKELEDILYLDTPSNSYDKYNYIYQHTKGEESGEERQASEHIILFNKEGVAFELSTQSSIIENIRNKSIEVSRRYFPAEYKDTLLGG